MRSRFVQTNILDDQYIQNSSAPELLASFLKGESQCGVVDVVYCSLVLSLFSEEQTYRLSSLVFDDFLQENGGVFFGRTAGSADPVNPIQNNDSRGICGLAFLHIVQSMKEMLEQIGYVNIKIEMEKIDFAKISKHWNQSDKEEPNKDNKDDNGVNITESIVADKSMITWYAEKHFNA